MGEDRAAISAELDAWLALVRAPALGIARLREALVQHGDAPRALAALRRRDDLDAATRRALAAPDPAALERDRAWLAAPNRHLLTWLDDDYPPLLREIANAPAALFVDGDASALWRPQIAIVGSRNASAGGTATARDFARTLVAAGFVVTSGLAEGIDAAAHAAALDAMEDGGCAPTIAVLGTGPDIVYPAAHDALAARIAAHGALVSEFPPGTPGRREHFPRRNRLISGLALGTLVVEASLRSGSLITARLASEQGREVFAIPGSIHHPLARGCHRLIRDGAKLVETAQEIVDELAPLAAALGARLRARLDGAAPMSTSTPTRASARPTSPARDGDYARLLAALGHDPLGIDALAARTGLTVSALSSMLLVLELEGEIGVGRGGVYTRRAPE